MGRKTDGKDGLPAEDARLWNLYTRDVIPMEDAPLPAAPVPLPAPMPAPSAPDLFRPFLPPPAPSHVAPATPPQLDGATMRKLRRGQIPIDARIDLHGMTQEKAHAALARFVALAAKRGDRCLLVITGKGKGLGEDRGILRRRLPDWLALPPLRGLVLRHQEAAPQDGGAGACYLYLQRKKREQYL